jgi:hypothetical protein
MRTIITRAKVFGVCWLAPGLGHLLGGQVFLPGLSLMRCASTIERKTQTQNAERKYKTRNANTKRSERSDRTHNAHTKRRKRRLQCINAPTKRSERSDRTHNAQPRHPDRKPWCRAIGELLDGTRCKPAAQLWDVTFNAKRL